MPDTLWEKPSDEDLKQTEIDKISELVKQSETVESPVLPPAEQALNPGKQHFDTGIMFRGERLLLETNNQEKLEEFKKAYHRIQRQLLGDYGN